MKKILIIVVAVIATGLLSSFVISKNYDKESNMSNDFVYYTSVTGWVDDTESYTQYIYYREGNGVRKYYTGDDPNRYRSVSQYYDISKNPLYKSSACNDFRRNYFYTSGPSHHPCYFNCNLPYFKQ